MSEKLTMKHVSEAVSALENRGHTADKLFVSGEGMNNLMEEISWRSSTPSPTQVEIFGIPVEMANWLDPSTPEVVVADTNNGHESTLISADRGCYRRESVERVSP